MIRVLIADDHAVVRRGIREILSEVEPVQLGEAADAHELVEQLRSQHWDILILDITMPGKSGLELLKELKQERPKLPVLVLTVHPESQYAVRVLRAGAAGYMTKESAPEELVTAVRKIVAGGKYVSGSLAEKLARDLEAGAERPLHEALSDREFQVLCLIASGKTVTEIAGELCLSPKTISMYRTRILEKMKMRTNAELMHYAMSNRLVD